MLVLFTKIGQILYRIWFYVLAVIPILLFSPFLLFFTASERWYPQFFWLARNIWAKTILYGMGCFPKISRQQHMQRGKSYMLVANHTSMLDIMLMLQVSRNPFVFVGKKELVRIPIFGFFYKRVCILVDREDSGSRTGVYRRANRRLEQGLSICIFPEGGVPEEDIILDTFKDGAFKMAIAHNIPIVPIVFLDNKQRFPFTLFGGGPGPVRAKVYPFIKTGNLAEEDKSRLREEVRGVILEGLARKKLRASYRT
ncbi:1-acyl-sn-glycerol-3-phosphate acyltransferase [Flavobacteriaceae bacterium F89]|uniref:1-acyl-sn-glycerol-3-phosphate acyltransferase n=1 Tax=Cerina litoralis TaxID=2874477 RepID=A0AAE3JSV9_9FLAO|nr:lysophospholipid acyltransferase family protein [Cerina litoralis]MCG2460922.1 1-acyl-sn-glycerol-3-phosphate acyltransferase [Cerina litoralis]